MAYRSIKLGQVDVMVHVPKGLVQRVLGSSSAQRMLERPPKAPSSDNPSLAERIAGIEWYHAIDLPGGLSTPGCFDHRALVSHYPLPEKLDGLRVLDVATFDGFWAFEMERRGAAEVVAIDIDRFDQVDMCPRIRQTKTPEQLAHRTGDGFRLAAELRGSKVKREVLNVYDLSPERLGHFDLVFISDLLLHLSNPMRALANVASVTRGQAIIVNPYNKSLPGRLVSYDSGEENNTWWELSFGALEAMVRDAGFDRVDYAGDVPMGCADHSTRHGKAVFIGHRSIGQAE